MDILPPLTTFSTASAKRVNIFQRILSELTRHSKVTNKKLKPLCDTRWVERHDSLTLFKDLYFEIIECLEELESDGDRDTSS